MQTKAFYIVLLVAVLLAVSIEASSAADTRRMNKLMAREAVRDANFVESYSPVKRADQPANSAENPSEKPGSGKPKTKKKGLLGLGFLGL